MMFYVARCRRAGFTLIEIMIVIAIIAILAGIAIPNIREARAEASLAACRQNILSISNALDMALIRNSVSKIMVNSGVGLNEDDYSGKVINCLIDMGFMERSPRCPISPGAYAIRLFYRQEPFGTGYRVMCSSYKNTGATAHRIGGKRITPLYYITDGAARQPDSSRPDGHGSCGWGDIVYDS